MNKKGSVFILSIFVVVILMILGAALLSRSISERNLAKRYLELTHAFWAAEGGVSRALNELKADYSQCGVNLWTGTLSSVDAGYSVDVSCSGQNRNITSTGFVPATGTVRAQRIAESVIRKEIPANFYDNAMYSAGDVDFNGTSYSVEGNIRYADDIDNTGNVTGEITNDPTISPLALLDFPQLLTISQGQGNVYDQARLQANESFPSSFWYSPPTDPSDPTTGVPNVVYVTEDLKLNGNIGTVGGFFVVVGDVITSPDDVQDATINGTGQVEGAIYTRGEFRINGGGGNLNVNGAVWAGEEARLNGNAHITYNSDYLSALAVLGMDAGAQVISWREQVNPYSLSP